MSKRNAKKAKPASPDAGSPIEFGIWNNRRLVSNFDGGTITTDAGIPLLLQAEKLLSLIGQVASCFNDRRDPNRTCFSVRTLVAQRIFGISLGYEDVNDHDELRHDSLMALISDETQRGSVPLAGKSTLNRLELSPAEGADRYCKISHDPDALQALLVNLFVQAHPEPPETITLDLDATDDLVHGNQEGRFFHGYYGDHCYLPLYIFSGRHLLASVLRPANVDASSGALEHVQRIVARLREIWPDVKITLRGDSGFAREELMAWCEQNQTDYVFGMPGNKRLEKAIGPELDQARELAEKNQLPARIFKDLDYRTLKSWSCERRVVAKAEALMGKLNPRFVVTSLSAQDHPAQALYEQVHCARGEMENRIKEQQMDMFADRTSTRNFMANQLRLFFSSFAYVLMDCVRREGLSNTSLARATVGSLRLKLLKIGARITTSVRRFKVAMTSGCPFQKEFREAWRQLSLKLEKLDQLRSRQMESSQVSA